MKTNTSPTKAMHYLISLFFSIFLLNVAAADDHDDIVSTKNISAPIVQLTPKEQAWLKNHKGIRIAYDGSLPPYSFVNDSGQLEGIAIEVMNILSKRLDIKFIIYPNTTWNKLYEAAAKHKVDVVATMVNRPDRSDWFIFTKPYLEKSLVIMTKRDNVKINNRTDLVGKTVTMVKGYQYADRVIEEFPSVTPYFVDSTLEGLNAVSTEKAEAAIIFLTTARYLQTKYLLNDLKVAAFYDRNSANESIAVRKDWPILATILQKGLDTLSKEEMQNIYSKWVPRINPRPSIVINPKPSINYRHIWTFVTACIIATAFMIVLVLLIHRIVQFRRQPGKISLTKSEVRATRKILQPIQNDHAHRALISTAGTNSNENKIRSLFNKLRKVSFFYHRVYADKFNLISRKIASILRYTFNKVAIIFPHISRLITNALQYSVDKVQGIFTYISRLFTQILQYIVDKFITFYHMFDTAILGTLKIDKYTKKSTHDIPNLSRQFEIYNAQKNIHWFEMKEHPIYDDIGKCIDVDDNVHEITEHKLTGSRLVRLSSYDDSLMQDLDLSEGNLAEFSITRQTCPQCGSVKTRKSSRRKNDRILRILFYKSYRCRECRYRFWMVNQLHLAVLGGMVFIIAMIVVTIWIFNNQQTTLGLSSEAINNTQIENPTMKDDAELQGGLHYILATRGNKDN